MSENIHQWLGCVHLLIYLALIIVGLYYLLHVNLPYDCFVLETDLVDDKLRPGYHYIDWKIQFRSIYGSLHHEIIHGEQSLTKAELYQETYLQNQTYPCYQNFRREMVWTESDQDQRQQSGWVMIVFGSLFIICYLIRLVAYAIEYRQPLQETAQTLMNHHPNLVDLV